MYQGQVVDGISRVNFVGDYCDLTGEMFVEFLSYEYRFSDTFAINNAR